jgi:GR25 family glycosyltransferase involved in LPS biosynthesis
MAKKISIDFSGQPITTGVGFLYNIQIGIFDVTYSNGSIDCIINFIPNGDTPTNPYDLPIGLTLADTLQITLDFLRAYYAYGIISYSLVDNTIEALIEADAIVTSDSDINDSITITQSDVEPSGENLIYYLIFDDYVLNIYKKNYLGTSSEIHGSFSIKKSSVDSILSPIRGTGLQISLEANQTLTFDEFSLADEFTYKTELLKSGQIIFEGYIKPDGTQQSFVNDEWLVNIEANDCLGALKDLSFCKANGLQYTGKMSFYDVIKACLDRTKLSMTINTSVAIEYVGYTGTNPLKDEYINSGRFIKNKDDSVLMDCNEVLTSILNLFSAVIVQQDGQWWIYRPNDLVLNGYTEFINQDTEAVFTKNLNAVLGSQINNFYPHHCEANQQIEVRGAISAYRLNYEYGFLEGFVLNPNLNHDDTLVYDNWTIDAGLGSGILINDPLKVSGVLMKNYNPSPIPFSLTEVIASTPFSTFEGTVLTFRAKVSSFLSSNLFYFKIKTSDGYFLNKKGEWVIGESTDPCILVKNGRVFNPAETFTSFEFIMSPVPNDCDVQVIICRPHLESGFEGTLCNVSYCQILDNEIQKQGIVGEFHTVTRFNPPSSITKENQKVFNGDGRDILIGSIYKADQETLTDLWTRKNKFENLPLLGISAMDDLRIQASPIQVFSGSIYGQIPYMSVVTIDNVTGLFMFIEYEFDVKSNIITQKLIQFYNSDIAGIEYQISPDYGNNTIKPTIKG